jgi:hypothetical protein
VGASLAHDDDDDDDDDDSFPEALCMINLKMMKNVQNNNNTGWPKSQLVVCKL